MSRKPKWLGTETREEAMRRRACERAPDGKGRTPCRCGGHGPAKGGCGCHGHSPEQAEESRPSARGRKRGPR